MIWQHVKTVVWLRYRIARNASKRAGKLNAVLTGILMALALLAGLGSFIAALSLGQAILPKTTPNQMLLLWTGLSVAFLSFWLVGLITQLQRSDALSLEKFLHLPISMGGAFVVNYLGSLVSLSLVTFLPAMVGISIAAVLVKGPAMLLMFPLLFSFLLMVTALTYQFRGWLASLMVNKRRRRAIMAGVTMGFVILCQLPNFMNIAFRNSTRATSDSTRQEYYENLRRLDQELGDGKLTIAEYQQAGEKLRTARVAKKEEDATRLFNRICHYVAIADMVLPPGWLAYGAMSAWKNTFWPVLAGSLGLTLIGVVSLGRAYQTTLRYYLGVYTAGKPAARRPTKTPSSAKPNRNFIERKLPLIPEQTQAIALANIRSLSRAPEVKMMLLMPVVMLLMFGAMMFRQPLPVLPEVARPFIPLGAVSLAMVFMLQLMQNQFGFERSGFRVYALCPAQRHKILLGKNLAMVPFNLLFAVIIVAVLQVMHPLVFTKFVATLLSIPTAFMIVCMVGNQTSIISPHATAAGSMKAASMTMTTLLINFVGALAAMLGMLPVFIPAGIGALAEVFAWAPGVPWFLLLAVLELVAVALIYRSVLAYQGRLLHDREQDILKAVAISNE